MCSDMVQSGLTGRTDVSQYRLTAHLSLALVIYCICFWVGLSLLTQAGRSDASPFAISWLRSGVRARLLLVLGMVAATIVSGAFVAGLNAGRILNTFPLMGGKVVPNGYSQLRPWLANIFENPIAVQFNHRLLAILTFLAVVYVATWSRKAQLPPLARSGVRWMFAISFVQVGLGIATLLSFVAVVPLAAAHQAGAVFLLTTVLVSLRGL
jgi:cytochrome c oxidase assembly protein subunit 15